MNISDTLETVALPILGILIASTEDQIDGAVSDAAGALRGRVKDSSTLIDDRVLDLFADKLRFLADELQKREAPVASTSPTPAA